MGKVLWHCCSLSHLVTEDERPYGCFSGSNPNKECPCLEIEFDNFVHPLAYPSDEQFKQLALQAVQREGLSYKVCGILSLSLSVCLSLSLSVSLYLSVCLSVCLSLYLSLSLCLSLSLSLFSSILSCLLFPPSTPEVLSMGDTNQSISIIQNIKPLEIISLVVIDCSQNSHSSVIEC